MSIFIPDMEMPNKCKECPCSGTYKDGLWVCEITAELLTSVELEDEKPEWCPLTHPVPPHGRLIDADALKKQSYPFPCAIGVEYAVIIRAINEAHTIIPAEEGE